jgi:hypothetical protein
MRYNLNKQTHNPSLGLLLLLFFFSIQLSGFSQGVAISEAPKTANSSAGLDVDFATKGLLIPRIALISTVSASPLSAHVTGMLIYNTATTGDVQPGVYINEGTRWVSITLQAGTNPGEMSYWNGNVWVTIPVGTTGQKLKLDPTTGLPVWGN